MRGVPRRSILCSLAIELLCGHGLPQDREPLTLTLGPAETMTGVGAAQGLEWRDGKLYLYGDGECGVIRELDVSTSPPRSTGREIRLTVDGQDRVPHPTGLTFHPDFGTFLGNTVSQKGTILHVDWEKMLRDGTLDGAVLNAAEDDLATNGSRPELVRLGQRWLVASSDYGASGNEVRLYDPDALKGAARTSEPGVLVHRFPCGPWVQSLHWIDERGLLVLVQNQVEGRRWRLTFVDLRRSVDEGRAVVLSARDFEPADELEGFHMVSSTTGFLVSSSERDNFRRVAIDWQRLALH
jgi:hypothetical protein